MKLLAQEIVSNSEMIKQYRTCREKAEILGKIFILKNNQPDAVLFSIDEYERNSVLLEHLESLDGKDIETFIASLPKQGDRSVYSIENLKNDINDASDINNASDINDVSDINDMSDVNDVSDVNDRKDIKSLNLIM